MPNLAVPQLRAMALFLALVAPGLMAWPVAADAAGPPADTKALTQAAQEGDADALFRLGDRYETGRGVEHDLAVAAAYMRLAALRGQIEARYRLGLDYAGGLGVEKDLAESYRWLTLAHAAGPDHDFGLLAGSLREAVQKQMSGDEMARAEKLVAGFKPVAGPATLPRPGATALAALAPAGALPAIDQIKKLAPRTECGPTRVAERKTGGILVSGFVPSNRREPVLGAAAKLVFERNAVAMTMTRLSPAVCDVLNLIAARPDAPDAGLEIVLRDETGRTGSVFEDGSYLVIEIPGLGADRFLTVDYFSHDGQVLHMHPGGPQDDNFLPRGRRLVLGAPGDSGQSWQIGPPFGRDLVVVFASERRLYSGHRPVVEGSVGYLKFLARRLAGTAPGDSVGVQYRVVTTEARRR